jgi:CRP-like cAMP-binding protein
VESEGEVKRLSSGAFFGEQALLRSGVRTATIVALTEVKCVGIGPEIMSKVLGNDWRNILYKNSIQIAMQRDECLKQLTHEQQEIISDITTIVHYQAGDIVHEADVPLGLKMFIVLKGGIS